MSINTVAITGNLTRDCEVRQTRDGKEVASFTVAVNDRRRNDNGEWVDAPNYIDCTRFNAGKLAGYLVKGAKVAIHGKLRWSQWERDGQKRSKISVIAEDIDFMGQRSLRDEMPSLSAPQGFYEDDLPF